uniref:TraH n=1 Tax=Legionella pneumophila TaxID=446 RepID=Q8RM83_LEGPN|nr:TraH [Legionella pneumophila]
MSNQDQVDKTIEEELQEAMRLLEQPMKIERSEAQSPTLSALDKARQPKITTACETCPNAIWFSSPEEVKCYCRIMHMITWSGKDSNLITMCDGKFLE